MNILFKRRANKENQSRRESTCAIRKVAKHWLVLNPKGSKMGVIFISSVTSLVSMNKTVMMWYRINFGLPIIYRTSQCLTLPESYRGKFTEGKRRDASQNITK